MYLNSRVHSFNQEPESPEAEIWDHKLLAQATKVEERSDIDTFFRALYWHTEQRNIIYFADLIDMCLCEDDVWLKVLSHIDCAYELQQYLRYRWEGATDKHSQEASAMAKLHTPAAAPTLAE